MNRALHGGNGKTGGRHVRHGSESTHWSTSLSLSLCLSRSVSLSLSHEPPPVRLFIHQSCVCVCVCVRVCVCVYAHARLPCSPGELLRTLRPFQQLRDVLEARGVRLRGAAVRMRGEQLCADELEHVRAQRHSAGRRAATATLLQGQLEKCAVLLWKCVAMDML